jgi:putative transposase
MGISEATLSWWKLMFKGVALPEVRRLRSLAEENDRQRKLAADPLLDKEIIQDGQRPRRRP